MTTSSENPWTERFAPLLNRDEIRRRVEVPPRVFTEFERLSPVQATREFERHLRELFFPSTQCVEILYEWVGLALEHCRSHYHGLLEFSGAVYEKTPPFPSFSFPMGLTGLAGAGKSQLLKALARLMPLRATFTAKDGTEYKLESYLALTVQVKGSSTDVLEAITGQSGKASALIAVARKRAYRDGWALLGIDEFQFLTLSDKANTRLVQLLMLAGYVGIPVVYIANFSMLHKLLRRNQEERQRLLANMRMLFPESPDSEDWVGMLEWHKRIAPTVFEFDAKGDAEAIHQLTGGINRAESKLLEVAFRRAMESGRPVGLCELEMAYKSRDYAVYKKDIELLSILPVSAESKKSHKDLWCPLDITPHAVSEELFPARRQERVGDAAVKASMNAAERDALKALTTRPSPHQKQNTPNVVSIDKTKSLAERLKEDALWYDENA